MNLPPAPNQDIFDVRKIRRLVELMKEHDLNEIDLQQGEVRIQLRRAMTAAGQAMVVAPLAPTTSRNTRSTDSRRWARPSGADRA